MKTHAFPRHNRLKSHNSISDLFSSSHSYGKRAIRFLWKIDENTDAEGGIKVVIAVPKRKLRKATDRNRVKRMIRESFRQNKTEIEAFLRERKINCNLGILYNSNKIENYNLINETMITLLAKYQDEYEKYAE